MGQKKMYIPLNPATKTYEGEVKFNNSENEFTGKKVSADEIELNGQDINQTFLTKQEAEELVRTEQLEDVVRENDIKDFITEDNADEKYLPNNKGKTLERAWRRKLDLVHSRREVIVPQHVVELLCPSVDWMLNIKPLLHQQHDGFRLGDTR